MREKHNVLVVAIQKPDGALQTATDQAALVEPGDIVVAVGQPDDLKSFAEAAREE